MLMTMDYVQEAPPEKKKPGGRPTRYQAVIDAARNSPGQPFRLKGEHHSSNIQTLKAHGLSVRSAKGSEPHKHILWVWVDPEEE